MANELQELRTGQKIPAKDMVVVVKAIYPKFDKPLLSKCEHGDQYGIDLRSDAMAALHNKYSTTAVATPHEAPETYKGKVSPKRDDHRLKSRVSCRLEDTEYQALLEFIKADGYDTMQAWLSVMIRRYIKRRAAKEGKNV